VCSPRPCKAESERDFAALFMNGVKAPLDGSAFLTKPSRLIGRYDPSLIVAGAEAYRRDVPGAEAPILDAGHSVLDEQAAEVLRLTEAFMNKRNGK
jgi:pimeloyl-ACP methyl ester carboxylesterase